MEKHLRIGFATGSTLGLFLAFHAIAAYYGWGPEFIESLSSLYIGYKPGIFGAAIGAFWGFFDGLIFGFILSWIYDKLTELNKKK